MTCLVKFLEVLNFILWICFNIQIIMNDSWGQVISARLPGGSLVKNLPANAGDVGSISGSGRSPGEGNDNPLEYSCLEDPMARGAWWAAVRGVAESRTRLGDWARTSDRAVLWVNDEYGTRGVVSRSGGVCGAKAREWAGKAEEGLSSSELLCSIWLVSCCFPDSCRESEELEQKGCFSLARGVFCWKRDDAYCCGGPEGK